MSITQAVYEALTEQIAALRADRDRLRAALEQAKKDALNINRQVSTFGLAHGMVARINAALGAADQPSPQPPVQEESK